MSGLLYEVCGCAEAEALREQIRLMASGDLRGILARAEATATALGTPAGHQVARWLRDLAPLADEAMRQRGA